jgi:hypothetical protein
MRFKNPTLLWAFRGRFMSSSASDRYLVELRNYKIIPSKFEEFLRLAESTRQLRQSLLPVLGMFKSDIDELNQFLHLYKYRDFDERDAVRERSKANEAWQAYLGAAKPMFQAQETAVFRPVSAIMEHSVPLSGDRNEQSKSMFEIRTYQFQAGYDTVPRAVSEFEMAIPSKIAAATQQGINQELSFFGHTDVGYLNTVIEIWRYPTAQECIRAREASRTVKQWKSCIQAITPSVMHFKSGFFYGV